MHQNSLETWHGEIQPTLRKRQLQVLKVYQAAKNSLTATDVMSITSRPRNVIHPRIGELRDLGYLVETGDKIIGGRKHALLTTTPAGEVIDTSKVDSITPEDKYYSKEDYKKIVREVYDHLAVQLNFKEQKELYQELKNFLATKE